MESNSRTITYEKNKLVLRFPYDRFVVMVVTLFPGRKFDNKEKLWTVPSIQVQNVVELLQPYGFTLDEKTQNLYTDARQLKKKVTRIKEGHFNHLEKETLETLNIPFYGYQKIGVGFICTAQRVLVADEPGTGKTIQSLGAVQVRQAKKVLIFCPLSAKQTWKEEIEKWLGPNEKVMLVGGNPKERKKQWKSKSRFYISNYHLLLRDFKQMDAIEWDFIIADEATDISNPKAKTTVLLKLLNSTNKVALTGTPISNTVKDLYSIMDWIQPGLLGTFWEFQKEYCLLDGFGSVIGYKNLEKLKDKIEPYFIRRLKSDVLTELPPKVYENLYTEFSPEERRLYVAIQEEIKQELREFGMIDKRNLSNAFVKLIRLKQMTCSEELITGENNSSKLNDLHELLQVVLAGNEKGIIFTQFRTMAYILARELAHYHPLIIAGDVNEANRNKNRQMFMEDDKHKLLIMTSAGNRSLNLQRASFVVHYDLPWSISAVEQREDRAHRSGQKKSVTIYRMLVKDSIDEFNYAIIAKKGSVSKFVLGDPDKSATTKISKNHLMNLLKT